MIYRKGRNGVSVNHSEAFRWFQKAAEQGDVYAQNEIGYSYRNGLGVKQDDKEAFRWFQNSAQKNDIYGMVNLAEMYEEGRGVKKDFKEALSLFKKAGEAGNSQAQYRAGFNIQFRGKESEQAEAVYWYRKAADGGIPAAMFFLGGYYLNGKGGVIKDSKQAVYWFDKAGEYDEVFTLKLLANEHPNQEKQSQYLLRAAEKGDVASMVDIGKRYYHGHGVKQSKEQAKIWFSKAGYDYENYYILGSEWQLDGCDLIEKRVYLKKHNNTGCDKLDSSEEKYTYKQIFPISDTNIESLKTSKFPFDLPLLRCNNGIKCIMIEHIDSTGSKCSYSHELSQYSANLPTSIISQAMEKRDKCEKASKVKAARKEREAATQARAQQSRSCERLYIGKAVSFQTLSNWDKLKTDVMGVITGVGKGMASAKITESIHTDMIGRVEERSCESFY